MQQQQETTVLLLVKTPPKRDINRSGKQYQLNYRYNLNACNKALIKTGQAKLKQ
jgi:hypothetical protein